MRRVISIVMLAMAFMAIAAQANAVGVCRTTCDRYGCTTVCW